MGHATSAGQPAPLGSSITADGVNFALVSPDATAVQLLLFDAHDDPDPAETLNFDPAVNRSDGVWHILVEGLRAGAHYAFRVDGPHTADDLKQRGFRFNHNHVLIDPYARGNTDALWNRGLACTDVDNVAQSMRSVVIDTARYNWEGDQPLGHPMAQTVIYEAHVRGFTRSDSSGVTHPGTFSGIVEKIAYLTGLGVTAVELLPVFDFDSTETWTSITGKRLSNYWGYDPFGYFAPHSSYCISPDQGGHIEEFRDMVKALHRAGIEVILDVVFNHTSEGNHLGPVISFKGLANPDYYLLSPPDRQFYMNFTQVGNTVNGNDPITEKLILDCLTFWVTEMHVDGFRFDLASILMRGVDGTHLDPSPVISAITTAPELAGAKVIAEPWAPGEEYLDEFPGRWAVWNDAFRDGMRRFLRGDPGVIGAVANGIGGSSEIFQGRSPLNGVNFITCHDGATLEDLVSYNTQRNEVNLRRDVAGDSGGGPNDIRDDCGAEGPSIEPNVLTRRARRIRNAALLLLLSQGVPMFTYGDEIRRTQQGNNNPWNQDTESSWFDWTQVDGNADVLRFWREAIALRARHPSLQRTEFLTGQPGARGIPDILWHGCALNGPGWNNPDCRVLAFTLAGLANDEPDLHVMMNMEGDVTDPPLQFEIPHDGRQWLRVADTSRASPDDIYALAARQPVGAVAQVDVARQSILVLESVTAGA